jgi:ATP-dependent RNA helicase RhlE
MRDFRRGRPGSRPGGGSGGGGGRSRRPAGPGSSAPHGARPASNFHAARPGFRGSRPAPRGRGGRGAGQYIDPARFINKIDKAVITESTEQFVPEHKFSDFPVDARLKANIEKKGYKAPSPIQDRSIPHVLRGADVVGIANTGTGKTAAFLIPLIDKVLKFPKEQVLILAPTRELAIQIENELKGFVTNLKIFSVVCVGGASIGLQLRELRYFNQFVIGTPGRVMDLIKRKALNLSGFKSVVLDEADRMLDMGFINDMKHIMSFLPMERQTLFFSATMGKDIEALIKDFLKEPVSVSVKTRDTSKDVDQDVVRIAPGVDKITVLADMLRQPGFDKVLVFGRTKHGVERLARTLAQQGFRAESIHGDKPHHKRQKALQLFKEHNLQVLVATDVAARGLDIAGVSHVINFDLPATYEDYVHRIGRTGRAGKKGQALTFIESR